MRHEFRIFRLWEQPTEIFLQRPGLLPYAALTQTPDRTGVLRQVAQKINLIPDQGCQNNLAAASGILAALVLEKDIIRRVLRRDLMRESSIYQELREEARAEVRAEIRAEAFEEARQAVLAEVRAEMFEEVREETKQRETNLVFRLLTRRLNQALPSHLEAQVKSLSLAQLEELGEALLDFTQLADLTAWFEDQQS